MQTYTHTETALISKRILAKLMKIKERHPYMSPTVPARVRTLGVSLTGAPTGRKPSWRMQTYTHTTTALISKRILAKLMKIKERHPYMSTTGPARVRTHVYYKHLRTHER